jgi:carbonic anhydrase
MLLELLEGIREFKNSTVLKESGLFAALSKGQSPDVFFITCADSRLSPHQFTGSGLGKLFILRNAGNIVPPYTATETPSGEAATIEFALAGLNCKEIVVCGHSHCGAMKGLMTPDLAKELPITAAWLKHSSILIDHLEKRHPDATDSETLLKHLTQDNVLLQMRHLETHPEVAKRLAEGTLKIHGWYYEIDTGEVYIFNPAKGKFISFEKTVVEVSIERLIQIVEDEALNYLRTKSSPKTLDEFNSLVQTYRTVRFTGVSSIWDQIEAAVKIKLELQLKKLYVTEDGSINPAYGELIKQGPAIRLKSLEAVSKAIKESPFYKELLLPSRGSMFTEAVPIPSSEPLRLRARL